MMAGHESSPSHHPPRRMAEHLSEGQLAEARMVFAMFDTEGRGTIGRKELTYALAKLGQHPSVEEMDNILAEFDTDENGSIDFEEFLAMMDIMGWNDEHTLSDKDLRQLQVSSYGQASIVRWLEDDHDCGVLDDHDGDVTGPDIPSLQRFCRTVSLDANAEKFIYLCIFVAAIVSGMQSYTVHSEFETAAWCVAVDSVILVVFVLEVLFKAGAENASRPHHFFQDPWNRFDFLCCFALVASSFMQAASTAEIAPLRLIRVLRAFRLLRAVRLFPNLMIVIETTIKSASSVSCQVLVAWSS